MDIYQFLLRPLLFSGLKADPEWLHHQLIEVLDFMDHHSSQPWTRLILSQLQKSLGWTDQRLTSSLWGLSFSNPLGLAAGFDKNGVSVRILPSFGFGFAEVGTVTYHSQPGNPRPRLFRLLQDQAALNRMGFNNLGAQMMQNRFETRTLSPSFPPLHFPLGINLGKSKITPLDQAADDYLQSFQLLKEYGDYFVVNVSSPNTPGLRSLQEGEQLSRILDRLQTENQGFKPILVKIAPDLEWEAIGSILTLAKEFEIHGIIATNTTISRSELRTQILPETGNSIQEEAGGISGRPLRQRSTEIIRFIWKETHGTLPIIGVGGIFNADDAWEKIIAGASLLQIYTGWIYEGPWGLRRILQGLSQKLTQQGFDTLSQAVGSEHN